MSVQNYEDLANHYGHSLNIAIYGKNKNVAIECENCNEILLDFDNEEVNTLHSNKDPMLMNNEEFREFIKDMNPDYADVWIVMRFEAIVSRLRKNTFLLRELSKNL